MKVFYLLTGKYAPITSLSSGEKCLVNVSLKLYKTWSWLQKVNGSINVLIAKHCDIKCIFYGKIEN